MIVKFKGHVEEIKDDSIHLYVNGITYKIFATTRDLNLITEDSKTIEVHVNQIFRDDGNFFLVF